MQKKYIFSGIILALLIVSYLFYRSCERDTIVIEPAERLSLPDSAWLSGSINLDQIRKELAWSALLNGDVFKLFQADTNSGTLIQIFKSPADFSILQQNNIPYVSIWKDTVRYTAIFFQIEHVEGLKKIAQPDSLTINQKTVYSFRTKEGIWMYNLHNLLFTGQAKADSLFAVSMFRNSTASVRETPASENVLLTANIQTQYIPDTSMHPLLKQSAIQLLLKNNSNALEIDWTYTGPAAAFFTQGRLPVTPDSTGFFFTCIPSMDSIQSFIHQMPQLHALYQNNNHALSDTLFSILDNNTFCFAFNGWRKVKNSYYTSVMNDEFEMVLQKKDTNFVEPIFHMQVTQPDKASATGFIAYLQKQGLISAESNSNFTVILGNFDSNLRFEKNNSLVLQNKHQIHIKKTGTTDSISRACVLHVQPQFISGLFDSKIKKVGFSPIDSNLKPIKSLEFSAFKNQNSLSGSCILTFNKDQHPVISCIQLLKK